MAALMPAGYMRLGVLTMGVSLLALLALVWAMARRRAAQHDRSYGQISTFIEHDPAACIVTSPDGEVQALNAAARAQFGAEPGGTFVSLLKATFANPGGIVQRLKSKALEMGAAREDVVTRRENVRLSVHRLGSDGYVWRLEALPDRTAARGQDGPGLPMLMLGRTDAVLFMNDAARALIGERVTALDRIFAGGRPGTGVVAELTTKTGVHPVYVVATEMSAGRTALFLLPAPEDSAPRVWNSFEDVPVPLLRVAPDGGVMAHNRSAADLVGAGLRENVPLSDLMEGLGRSITDWLSETLAGRAVQNTEFLRLKRSDKEVFVQVSLNRVSEGGNASIIAVLTDATELKTLEAQFVQSQKMQAIGQLAGGVAHDFNNLLTAISGHCDLLLLRHDQGDPDYSDLVQINQNANRAAALVGQLLAFSRKQTLRPETLDMRDTMSDLTHLLNRLVGERVTLTLTHDPVLQAIRADKRQLEQVMMNLVVNARDAMPGGGEIRIETECVTLDTAMERDRVSVPEGAYVAVRVIDEGCGIPRDKLQKVFEPFYTTKRTGEGTGLGLSTAYGIIKQTGGFIFVDSELGVGTTFTLMFPILEEQDLRLGAIDALPADVVPKNGDGVILLVEDEAPVRAFASRALRLRGYTVLEADSAESALRTLEDSELSVDLFVTDVVMPGKDGPTWVREALESRPDVRVVFVSGYAEDKMADAQEHIPNSVFLPKPFSLNDLTETVHRQLH
ncbi:MAG: ATP-binding protein [Pseudomonadota bacterium]